MKGRKPRITSEGKKGVRIGTLGKACLTTPDTTETILRAYNMDVGFASRLLEARLRCVGSMDHAWLLEVIRCNGGKNLDRDRDHAALQELSLNLVCTKHR